MARVKGLMERLSDGESIVCAEGYMREFERRGFLRMGDNTPEVVLRYPQRVKELHEEFVNCGSDVVEAYTYYAHRQKLKTIGREDDVCKLNKTALKIARDVADATGTLMAGNICNTTIYDPNDPKTWEAVEDMFKEQIEWAVEERADFIIGETFNDFGEAKLALQCIKQYADGIPAVITQSIYCQDTTTDDVIFTEALRGLEELGADVVGLNCGRGPSTMMPLLREARKVCKGPLAALPVPYRTTDKEKGFQSLTDPLTGEMLYPLNRECCMCSRSDLITFAREARNLGISYVGLCCGALPSMIRDVAQAYGKNPPASRFAPDPSITCDSFMAGTGRTPHTIKKSYFATGKVN